MSPPWARELRWLRELLLGGKNQVCRPKIQETPCFDTCTAQMWGTSTRVPVKFINFSELQTKCQEMQRCYNILWYPSHLHPVIAKHTTVSELMNIEYYCPVQEGLRKPHCWQKSDYSVQHDDSWECGEICVLLILKKKKAPELYGENHRLGNFRTVISSLGPICFPYSLGQVVSVFCFFSSPLSLHGLVYLYCRFSNTWNYSWDSTTE